MNSKLNFSFASTQKIITKLTQLDTFKGKWKDIERDNDPILTKLRKVATVQSVGASTRIEGSTLSDREVADLVENLEINKLKDRDEQEVAGYKETLDIIIEQYAELELREYNIFALHNALMRYSSKDQKHRGRYKQLSNKVVAQLPDGTYSTIFNTTEPYLVKKEMEELLVWFHAEATGEIFHPLLRIGAFIYEFLSIHPFQDGNGRLSRLLTTLLLLRSDYSFVQSISFENQIELHKDEYYQALMEGQRNRYQANEIIEKWILYFLNNLIVLTEKVWIKYETGVAEREILGVRETYLNQRQRQILDFLHRQNEPISSREISEQFPEISKHTLRHDLRILAEKELMIKRGRGRGTSYQKA